MKIHFLGAAGEVTGSAYLVETTTARVLIDLGLFQGSRQGEVRNRAAPLFEAARLDAVVLTHAHIDHVGRMPLLPRWGYRGRIWATPATIELAGVMLRDSAEVQVIDAAQESRRNERLDRPSVDPLYTVVDVERVLKHMSPSGYDAKTTVAPGIDLRFVDAGHIIGSASVELTVTEGGSTKVICFSGDIGTRGHPIMHDPKTFDHADVIVMESTYGDRNHRSLDATKQEFEQIIQKAVWDRQRVLIPAFALGRTQVLMYHLCELGKSGRVPEFPVYIDSPLAEEATRVHQKFRRELDPAAREIFEYGDRPGCHPSFTFTVKREESQRLNSMEGCMVIIAASGMCTGGRILHHLRHHIWKHNTQVLIVGYQGEGTLGRRLVDGAKVVRIMGDWLKVRADIHTLGGFSAHAGQDELVDWTRPWAKHKPRVFLTHGEDQARLALGARLERELGLATQRPVYADAVEI